MNTFHEALEDYLSLRRSLGSKLYVAGLDLHRFIEFLDREGSDIITTQLAVRWATSPPGISSIRRTHRLGHVRQFAAWLSTTDPRTEIPPRGVLPRRYCRRPPYIYSDEEIGRIVHEAARLPSATGLRAETYATLFGLLAATGLRISEALALDREDVDLGSGVLAIRRGKFGKARFVPVHESACAALSRYTHRKDLLWPHPASPAYFLGERGKRITKSVAEYTFAVVSRAIGLRQPTRPGTRVRRYGRGPRMHDMRHRFAARTLVRWYREGRDVERELPKLSTYLGHANVTHTYWYIEAVPELLRLATDRATGPRKDSL